MIQAAAAGILLLHHARAADPFLDTLVAGEESLPEPVAILHQAAGFLRGQQGCTAQEAVASLRAYAFAHQCPLADVAVDVVNRRLTLPAQGDSP
ncbi:ANTAR domain-containing protein [Streptomyces sp. NPDC102467]|uniref:ANTAR domain-containing protein n=1 Tax=Streptomyces sp. NPDC102467 TaxID=3366179 RepID=UPI0038124E09